MRYEVVVGDSKYSSHPTLEAAIASVRKLDAKGVFGRAWVRILAVEGVEVVDCFELKTRQTSYCEAKRNASPTKGGWQPAAIPNEYVRFYPGHVRAYATHHGGKWQGFVEGRQGGKWVKIGKTVRAPSAAALERKLNAIVAVEAIRRSK